MWRRGWELDLWADKSHTWPLTKSSLSALYHPFGLNKRTLISSSNKFQLHLQHRINNMSNTIPENTHQHQHHWNFVLHFYRIWALQYFNSPLQQRTWTGLQISWISLQHLQRRLWISLQHLQRKPPQPHPRPRPSTVMIILFKWRKEKTLSTFSIMDMQF